MVFPASDLEAVPYLAVQIARWNTSGVIELPMETEFQGDLPLLVDIIRIANKVEGWEELIPQTYQLMFKMIRLAYFVGVDPILEVAANYLGTHPSRINNSNGIHAVRMRVRNAYRMAQKIAKFQVDKIGHTCMVCKQTNSSTATFFTAVCHAMLQGSDTPQLSTELGHVPILQHTICPTSMLCVPDEH